MNLKGTLYQKRKPPNTDEPNAPWLFLMLTVSVYFHSRNNFLYQRTDVSVLIWTKNVSTMDLSITLQLICETLPMCTISEQWRTHYVFHIDSQSNRLLRLIVWKHAQIKSYPHKISRSQAHSPQLPKMGKAIIVL